MRFRDKLQIQRKVEKNYLLLVTRKMVSYEVVIVHFYGGKLPLTLQSDYPKKYLLKTRDVAGVLGTLRPGS